MRFAAIFLLAIFPALAADQWTRVTTPHFELYTTDSAGKGKDALLYFEQIRSFMLGISGGSWDQPVPVRIIAFRSEKQFRPYAPNDFVFAYYTGTESRDYIVMEDIDQEHFPSAIHEYIHLVTRRAGMKLPTWLNEGWADLFSTLKPIAGKAMIGQMIPGRAEVLMGSKLIPVSVLTSVNEKSNEYNEKNRASMFYAESWALTHMLFLDKIYHQNFSKLLAAFNAGKSTEEAFQFAYQKSTAQVEHDFQQYFGRNSLNVGLYDEKLQDAPDNAKSVPVKDSESSLVIADLLFAANKRTEAKAAYEKLVADHPDNSEILRSLGYLAWRDGDRNAARQYFEKALDGTDDPLMCLHLASFYTDSSDSDKRIRALQKALILKSDYTEARMDLAFTMMNIRNYDGALASFAQLKNIKAEYASRVFNAQGYAYAYKGDLASARKVAEDARKWDKTEAEKQQTEQLVKYLDAREETDRRREAAAQIPSVPGRNASTEAEENVPPGEPVLQEQNPVIRRPGELLRRVQGTLEVFDCSATKPRLVVSVDGKLMKFELTDPDRVQLLHDGKDQFEFNCGPQKKFSITVEYVPDASLAEGIAGAVRRLVF